MYLNRFNVFGTSLIAAVAVVLAPMQCAFSQKSGLGMRIELVDPDTLRVCADPNNLPFSNDKGEGFENKIAEFLAPKLGRKSVSYIWFPMVTGFVRRTLGAHRCDIIIGYPQGDELVQNTNAYYRTAYALVFKSGRGLDDIVTLEDPGLRDKRIGVVAGTPPASNLAAAGLMPQVRPYPLMVDTRLISSSKMMTDDIRSGEIDVGILWGPLAAHFAAEEPALKVVPLTKETTGPRMIYRITMGVRPSDQEWKRTLNKIIRENQNEINSILHSFDVPLLDEKDNKMSR
ncbi:quinoprotein dehydrogenase-associated probable ABC transporter substrate-binding protein [Rhodoligotrophos appendicifer]